MLWTAENIQIIPPRRYFKRVCSRNQEYRKTAVQSKYSRWNVTNPFNLNSKPSRYEKKVWLTLKLVNTANKYGWMRTLAYFIKLRSVHSNGIFYKYSIRKLSNTLNCSPACLSHHLKIMSKNGLISLNNGNLKCIGRDAMFKLYKSATFPVKLSADRKNQLTLLKSTLLIRKLKLENKAIEAKKAIIKMHKSKFTKHGDAKVLLMLERKFIKQSGNAVEISLSNNLMLSNNSIGKLINRSKSTGLRLQKELNRLGVIKSSKNTVQIEFKPISFREFRCKYISNKYVYCKCSGLVYLSLPNIIKVL